MSLVQKWLRQASQAYGESDRVYVDVDAALNPFPTLKPKTDVYTYDDGRVQLLLCIHGLLPIVFRGVSYNIPIAIWLQSDYPRSPPIVYVVPNNDMLVRASKMVDPSGKCTFPYLLDWDKKSEGRSIRVLLDLMQEHFSREPPLYAKPKTAPGVNTQSSAPRPTTAPPNPPTGNATPIVPPRPGAQTVPPPTQESQPSGTPVYRPPPLLPTAAQQASPTTSTHARSYSVTPVASPPPPPPHQQDFRPHRWSTIPNSTPPPPPPPGIVQSPPPPPTLPSTHPQTQIPAPHPYGNPSQPYNYQYAPNQIATPSPPPPRYVPAPAPPVVTSPPPVAPTPIPNILDADDTQFTPPSLPLTTAAPPRPPNPELVSLHNKLHEKFTKELQTFYTSISQEAERLRAAQTDLLAGEPAVRDEMARLDAVRDVCSTVRNQLSEVVRNAEAAVNEMQKRGDPEVDELVLATNIVHNQLINLVAEDHAIEDTIYHLHRALNAGRLDLDKLLKTVQLLAEEQFMKRALVDKIVSQLPMSARMG